MALMASLASSTTVVIMPFRWLFRRSPAQPPSARRPSPPCRPRQLLLPSRPSPAPSHRLSRRRDQEAVIRERVRLVLLRTRGPG
uniref:Uncharacterized protein n=1 Tax=Arundo donax TaxID=35708 RepID=A0A0A9FP72_ARUDO